MNKELSLLLKTEIKATFRASTIAYIVVVTILFVILRFFSVYANWGIIGSAIYPIAIAFIFWYSRNVKGSGNKVVGFLLAPVERDEYVKSKYIFASLGTILSLPLQLFTDFLVLNVLNQIPRNQLSAEMINSLGYDGLLAFYPYLLLILMVGQSISLFTATCGKIAYKISLLLCLFSMSLMISIWDLLYRYGFLTSFIKKLRLDFKMYLLWLLICSVIGIAVILVSFKNCRKDFKNFDIG